MFCKPDNYFEAGPWRRQPGGGPLLINMVHEVGNLRSLCGEIVAVQAFASSATRNFPVEDTGGGQPALRERGSGHVHVVRHRSCAAKLGTDDRGGFSLLLLSRRRLLHRRRNSGLAGVSHHAPEILRRPGTTVLVEPVRKRDDSGRTG